MKQILNYALVCPTRGRPKQIKIFAESVFKTATSPDRVEILLYIDTDDRKLKDYETSINALQKSFGTSKIKPIFGPSIGVPRAANKLFDSSTGDIFLTSNDDQVFISTGWDERLDIEVVKYPDGIFCFWFNDDWESENFCTFPIVSRKWIETLGYLQFPFFEHFFADTWIWMLAKMVNRAFYLDDITVEHRHWKTGKSIKDHTYEKHLTTEHDSKHNRDRAIIDKFERYFFADVEALKKNIDKFKR